MYKHTCRCQVPEAKLFDTVKAHTEYHSEQSTPEAPSRNMESEWSMYYSHNRISKVNHNNDPQTFFVPLFSPLPSYHPKEIYDKLLGTR